MADFAARPLLITDMVAVWDVICPGAHRHMAEARQSPAGLTIIFR
jgi:hypothetical protein